MNRNKILLLVSIASACALAGTALVTNATLKNSDVRALTRGGSTPYQLVLGRTNQIGWSSGNSGGQDYTQWNLSIKTQSESDFPVTCKLWKGSEGKIDYPAGYICNGTFYDGNPYLEVTLTLKGISSPVSVVLDGTFENSTNSTPATNQLTYTDFTDNGDGTYSFLGSTSAYRYRHIQLATVTVNYTC